MWVVPFAALWIVKVTSTQAIGFISKYTRKKKPSGNIAMTASVARS